MMAFLEVVTRDAVAVHDWDSLSKDDRRDLDRLDVHLRNHEAHATSGGSRKRRRSALEAYRRQTDARPPIDSGASTCRLVLQSQAMHRASMISSSPPAAFIRFGATLGSHPGGSLLIQAISIGVRKKEPSPQ